MINILQAIQNEITQTKRFQYVPTRGAPFDLVFVSEVCSGGSMASWSVIYGGVGSSIPTLILKDKHGILQASLTLEKSSGKFSGRERGSAGASLCYSVSPDREAFKLLADPTEWYRHQEKIQGAGGFGTDDCVGDFQFSDKLGPQVDWAPYEYDLAKLVKRENLVQSNTAVALIGCDRHAYFQRTVEYLAKNPEIHKMPVFLFLDVAWQDARKDEIEKHKEIVKKYIPHCVIIVRPRNYGCGRNIIDARVQLFTNMGYDRVFLFEDDMTPTPQYMRLCMHLLDWAQAKYTNVGVVQAWTKCIMSRDRKDKILSEVHATYTNWWGYLQTAESWKAMEPIVLRYQHLFLGGSYSHRSHRSIIRFFNQMRVTKPVIFGDVPYVCDTAAWNVSKAYFDAPPTGQDAVTMHALEQTGFVRVALSVNRGSYIGRYGIHMYPKMFERDGFQHVEYTEYPDDAVTTKFTPRGAIKVSEISEAVPDLEVIDTL